jgi:hypothetical protein
MTTIERRIEQPDCERCGGFMIEEGTRDTGMILRRCVMCGERVDTVILLHRQKSLEGAGGKAVRSSSESPAELIPLTDGRRGRPGLPAHCFPSQ